MKRECLQMFTILKDINKQLELSAMSVITSNSETTVIVGWRSLEGGWMDR